MVKSFLVVIILTVAVVMIAGLGFYLAGSPIETRGVKFDTLRVQDIGKIKTAIDLYYSNNKKMPTALTQLLEDNTKSLSSNPRPYLEKELKDPKTKKDYEYKDLGNGKYQLCAEFETSSEDIQERKTGVSNPPSLLDIYSYSSESRLHPKGHYCFDYTIAGYVGALDSLSSLKLPSSSAYNDVDSSAYLNTLVDPAKQFAMANNTQRRSNVNSILNAIHQFAADNKGQLPGGIDATVRDITDSSAVNTINLCKDLIPTYLADLPLDPSVGTESPSSSVCTDTGAHYDTKYTVVMNSSNGLVTVVAPFAELGETITVTR